jgi:hypothetical protein
MNKIFVAFPFKPKAGAVVKDVVDAIGRLITSHGLVAVTGESLGGNALTPAVQRRIGESDALVALFTREKRLARGNKWLPTQWVQSEITAARARGKPAVALVEPGVEVSGLFEEHERIDLDPRDPLDALLQLSEAVRAWKEDAGRFLLVRLLPDEAAALAQNGSSQCKVRLVPPQGPAGGWDKGTIRQLPGGVFLAVPGVRENVALDVEILNGDGRPVWKSGEFPQWVHVQMRSV